MRLLVRNKVEGCLCRLLGVDDVVGLCAGVLSTVGRGPSGVFFDRLCLKINWLRAVLPAGPMGGAAACRRGLLAFMCLIGPWSKVKLLVRQVVCAPMESDAPRNRGKERRNR